MTSTDPTGLRPVERREFDGLVLAWSPDTRILHVTTAGTITITTGNAGLQSVEAINAWVGGSTEPFGYLCDNSGIEDSDAAARAAWAECFDAHRKFIRAAWYGQSPHMQVMLRMFITGLRAKGPFIGNACLDEDEARTWLRGQKIDA